MKSRLISGHRVCSTWEVCGCWEGDDIRSSWAYSSREGLREGGVWGKSGGGYDDDGKLILLG